MRCPGGKGKCYQHIINILPPHAAYIETHLGGGAVLRHKKPARTSIGIDRDPAVVETWRRHFPDLASYVEADALDFLASHRFVGNELVYCDPPYLPSTRRRARVYRYDYDEHDHIRLLGALRNLPCHVVVSGYASVLYDRWLNGWNTQTFSAKAHDALRQEKLWFNFDVPAQLHDPRYLGRDFRERQTVKRRIERLQRRISALSPPEQYRLFEWLDSSLVSEGQDAAFLLIGR
jgi:DNA adenine methylase